MGVDLQLGKVKGRFCGWRAVVVVQQCEVFTPLSRIFQNGRSCAVFKVESSPFPGREAGEQPAADGGLPLQAPGPPDSPLSSPRHRLRWHSFQSSHRPSLNSVSLQINCQSVAQMNLLQKYSLLKLTALLEKYTPSNKHGFSW